MNINENKRLEKWNKERGLDKLGFDKLNAITLLLEEEFELFGYKLPKENRESLKKEFLDFLERLKERQIILPMEDKDEHYEIDALADIVVIAKGEIVKKGYDIDMVMDETLKEIESRTGKIENGKFIKDTSEEAIKKWYKADYAKAKKD
jgi:hypothetical protein